MKTVVVDDKVILGAGNLCLIAGPCVIEDLETCQKAAAHAQQVCDALGIGFVFKASFDKANRTSIDSYRGPGLERGLEILAKIKAEFDVPVLTDVHEVWQAEPAGEVVDILQIPAFLCRQTDLLLACAHTERVVNVKKGQFVAPHEMENAVRKLESADALGILLTERGSSFGYNQLIVDMAGIGVMQQFGYPVIFDATHSVQRPGGLGTASGGNRDFVPSLTLAAIAAGADALFIETHPDPSQARSDAATQLPLDELEPLLKRAVAVWEAVRS